jgi:hypothetical protein
LFGFAGSWGKNRTIQQESGLQENSSRHTLLAAAFLKAAAGAQSRK